MRRLLCKLTVLTALLMLTACFDKDSTDDRDSTDETNLEEQTEITTETTTVNTEPEDETGASDKGNIEDQDTVVPVFEMVSENEMYCSALDMTVIMPHGWTLLDQEVQNQMANVGEGMSEANGTVEVDGESKSAVDAVNLLAIFKHPLNAQVTVNPNLIITAQPTNQMTAETQLDEVSEALIKQGLPIVFEQGIEAVKVGSQEFLKRSALIETGMGSVQQDYYAAVNGSYMVTMVVTYADIDDVKTMEAAFGLD